MSFSVYFIGTPEKVSQAVGEYVGKLTGQSQQEYAQVMPHIQGIVNQNIGANKVIAVEASGHASIMADGTITDSTCNVTVSAKYGLVV